MDTANEMPPGVLFWVPVMGADEVTLELFSCDAFLPDGRRYYDRQQLTYAFERQSVTGPTRTQRARP
jgi:hypothetical protein